MNDIQDTFYWHDYETSGIDPARDRPMQFAGIRTDAELNQIGEPLELYCRLADDCLPHPEACLITGITPQKTLTHGVSEAEFIARIHHELSQQGTCGVGFNSLRFDDEVTRNTLYRNFYDPYGREWQNGCSRWDLIDMLRLARAIRPDGIIWPVDEQGKPSLKLENLTVANGLAHENAHDALSDVRATIAMARLLRQAQPKLFDYVLGIRDKQRLSSMLDRQTHKPVIHVSGMIPTEYGNLALVAPLTDHPTNRNSVLVWDLRYDPQVLLDLSAEELRDLLYKKRSELPEDAPRVALKEIHLNRCPIIAPAKMLTKEDAARLSIDGDQCRKHLELLRSTSLWQQKVREIYEKRDLATPKDPELMLYSGGFFSKSDRKQMDLIHAANQEELAVLQPAFQDIRLEEMFLRYKARNFFQLLDEDEVHQWEQYRRVRLLQGIDDKGITMRQFFDRINALYQQPNLPSDQRALLEELATYGEAIYPAEIGD